MRLRLALALLVAAATAVARADGAFPDSLGLLLPLDRPLDIIVSTNFGLLFTHDGGVTWRWICEPAISPIGPFLYTVAPPPADTVLALDGANDGGVLHGADLCSWTVSTGAEGAVDAFVDPSDAAHVAAVGYRAVDGGTAPTLYESVDGAGSFAPIWTAPPAAILYGVEIARTAPHTLYASMSVGQTDPYLVARGPGGSFTTRALAALTGTGVRPFILTVDPTDAATVYLRVYGADHDAFAVLSPTGDKLTYALPTNVRMTSFVRRANGTMLLGTQNATTQVEAGVRSTDNGQSFQPWNEALHLRALGERDGILYAVADNLRDHFALASSTDEGAHWTPLLRFEDLCGPATCVATACGAQWSTLQTSFDKQGMTIVPPPACSGVVDGGAMDLAAPIDLALPVDLAAPAASPASGCGCDVGGRSSPTWALVLAALLLGLRNRLKARPRARHRRS